jgi:hypothetical protein
MEEKVWPARIFFIISGPNFFVYGFKRIKDLKMVNRSRTDSENLLLGP